MNATVKQPLLAGGQTLSSQTIIKPLLPDVLDQLEMQSFLWTVANPQSTQQGQWQYCFLQTASVSRTFTIPANNPFGAQPKVAGPYTISGPSAGLDTTFPYRQKGPYASLAAVNNANVGDGPTVGVFANGGASSYKIEATTYFMCQAPNSAVRPSADGCRSNR